MREVISYDAEWFSSYTGYVAHLESKLKVINIPYVREILLNKFLDKLKSELASRGLRLARLHVYDRGGLLSREYLIIVDAVPTGSLIARLTAAKLPINPALVSLLIWIVRIVVIALFIKFLMDYVVLRAFSWWKSLPKEEREKITGTLYYGVLLLGSAMVISGIARLLGVIYGKPSKT